jgi:hypothetical protein
VVGLPHDIAQDWLTINDQKNVRIVTELSDSVWHMSAGLISRVLLHIVYLWSLEVLADAVGATAAARFHCCSHIRHRLVQALSGEMRYHHAQRGQARTVGRNFMVYV